ERGAAGIECAGCRGYRGVSSVELRVGANERSEVSHGSGAGRRGPASDWVGARGVAPGSKDDERGAAGIECAGCRGYRGVSSVELRVGANERSEVSHG